MENSTKYSLSLEDLVNIQTALKYVANDMRSEYFKEKFLSTLYKVVDMEVN